MTILRLYEWVFEVKTKFWLICETYRLRSNVPSSSYLVRISSKLEISWLKVSRSMTKQVTPCGESQMMLAVRRSSLRVTVYRLQHEIYSDKIQWRKNLPMQCFLAEKVAFTENPNEFLLLGVWLSNCHAHLTLWNDEECVATSTLPNNVVALLVECFLQYVRDFNQRVFG